MNPELAEGTTWGVDVSVQTLPLASHYAASAEFKIQGLALPLPDFARVKEIGDAVRELVERMLCDDDRKVVVTDTQPFCEQPAPYDSFMHQHPDPVPILVIGRTEAECELRWDWPY